MTMRMTTPFKWLQSRVAQPQLALVPMLAAALFLFGLLFGFFVSFPDTVLRDRFVAEVNRRLPTGNRFAAESIALRFPLRLQALQARLSMDNSPLPELQLTSVVVNPTLSFLFGNAGAAISVDSELGRLEGTVFQSGAVDLHLRDGRFDLAVPDTQLSLSGQLASVDLVGQLQADRDEAVKLQAVVDKLLLSGVKQIGLSQDELALGSLTAALEGVGRDLQVRTLELADGAIAVSGSGRLVLQQPLGASRIDLTLQLRPVAGADPGLQTLLELLSPPGKDGSHTIQLRGRLMAPQLK